MNNKINKLINSDKYKPLKLVLDENNNIYTNKYEDYSDYVDVLDGSGFVCGFTDTYYALGLIDSYVTFSDYYNWDEELEAEEQTFCNSFIPLKDMQLFLEFELDLLNILSDSTPKIIKSLESFKANFDDNSGLDFEAKFTILYKYRELMRYYYDDFDKSYQCSLLACADIEWESYNEFPTWKDYEDDYWDIDDDNAWYKDEDEQEAGINKYKQFSFEEAKNVIYTLLKILKDL